MLNGLLEDGLAIGIDPGSRLTLRQLVGNENAVSRSRARQRAEEVKRPAGMGPPAKAVFAQGFAGCWAHEVRTLPPVRVRRGQRRHGTTAPVMSAPIRPCRVVE